MTALISIDIGQLWLSLFERPSGVINEVDYVQPAIDEGEFINLYNPGPDALSLVAGHIQLLTFLPRPCRR